MEGCFLLDSSVVLAYVAGDFPTRLTKFRRDVSDYKLPCFVTKSVAEESKSKIDELVEFLDVHLRALISKVLQKIESRRKDTKNIEMTWRDLFIFERTFIELFREKRKVVPQTRIVEEWIVDQLSATFASGDLKNIDDFFVDSVSKLMQIIQDIQDRFDVAIRLKQQFTKIVPESDAKPNIEMVGKLRTKRFPRSDANHLSSAREYQKTTKKPVVFVSFDYKDIVNRKATIQQLIGLVCSDPIYGLYHLMRLQKK